MCALPLACGLASADSITVQASNASTSHSCFNLGQSCTDTFNSAFFQQFDPSLGTLQSVDYTFTDVQSFDWGWNDEEVPFQFPGLPYQITFDTAVDSLGSPFIGLSKTSTQTFCCANGTHLMSFSDAFFGQTVTASGEFDSGLNQFIGTSFTGFGDFQGTGTLPSTFYRIFPDPQNPSKFYDVFFGLHSITDYDTVQVTYNYTPAVPEPRYTAVLVSLCLLAAVLCYRGKPPVSRRRVFSAIVSRLAAIRSRAQVVRI
jgi:hypothetical protein